MLSKILKEAENWNRCIDMMKDIVHGHEIAANDICVPTNDGWIPVDERLPKNG